MQQVTIKIEGMTCGGCTNSVNNVLRDISGVNSVEVSLSPGQASIEYDDSKVGLDDFKAAIEGAGFDVVE